MLKQLVEIDFKKCIEFTWENPDHEFTDTIVSLSAYYGALRKPSVRVHRDKVTIKLVEMGLAKFVNVTPEKTYA